MHMTYLIKQQEKQVVYERKNIYKKYEQTKQY